MNQTFDIPNDIFYQFSIDMKLTNFILYMPIYFFFESKCCFQKIFQNNFQIHHLFLNNPFNNLCVNVLVFKANSFSFFERSPVKMPFGIFLNICP